MTKEEYKENIIRMWDSLRSKYKGENCCAGVICTDCPCSNGICNNGSIMSNAYEAIDLVENWAKEHPIVTNADKFKEMFGLDMAPIIHSCVSSKSCEDCEYTYDGECAVSKLFWDAEYMPKKRGEE